MSEIFIQPVRRAKRRSRRRRERTKFAIISGLTTVSVLGFGVAMSFPVGWRIAGGLAFVSLVLGTVALALSGE